MKTWLGAFMLSLLAAQAFLLLQFMPYRNEVLVVIACQDADYLACHYPWWWVLVFFTLSVMLLAYAIYHKRQLSYRWWYGYLPVAMMILTLLMGQWLPLIMY